MKRFWMVFLAALLLLTGCAASQRDEAPLKVIVTNFPPYDFVRAIAGESGRVSVSMLIKPGAESHSFEPTPQDLIALDACDLFVYGGGESDSWVDGMLDSLDGGDRRVLRMMDMVEVREEEVVEGMQADEEEGAYDEHVWTSPVNAAIILDEIEKALCELDPDGAAAYAENAAAYRAQLEELDGQFRQAVDKGARRTLVFGDRFPFRYFVEEYGLDYWAAFPGCSSETEPSAATLAFLIDKVREEKIPVVLHLELSNTNIARTICEETGAQMLRFHSCHNLTRREMDEGLTYVDLMRENLAVLEEALA